MIKYLMCTLGLFAVGGGVWSSLYLAQAALGHGFKFLALCFAATAVWFLFQVRFIYRVWNQ